MSKKIPFELLRTGDLVHTTSLSFLATAIRIREVGLRKAFDKSIATHTGIVVLLEGGKIASIAEMVGGGLKLNSFSDYDKKGFLDPCIISVTRHNVLDDPNTLEKFRTELLRLWKEGKKYDPAGALKWAFPFLKDKNKDFYCSELAEYLAIFCGFSFYRQSSDKNDNVMPYGLQSSSYMIKVF
jgi:hypothetical protein